jgi:hypothetical protein
MIRRFTLGILFFISLCGVPAAGFAFGVGHHGGIILNCTAPIFFEESPARDARVDVFEKFSFTASDNTDPTTLKAWVNTHPVDIKVTPQRSGRFTVEGRLPQPIVQGKVWIKVTGISNDGCDQLHNWNIYTGN